MTGDGDRYAAMGAQGPCPTCGHRGDGVPVYRPQHPAPISPAARAEHLRFAAKPEGRPNA